MLVPMAFWYNINALSICLVLPNVPTASEHDSQPVANTCMSSSIWSNAALSIVYAATFRFSYRFKLGWYAHFSSFLIGCSASHSDWSATNISYHTLFLNDGSMPIHTNWISFMSCSDPATHVELRPDMELRE